MINICTLNLSTMSIYIGYDMYKFYYEHYSYYYIIMNVQLYQPRECA